MLKGYYFIPHMLRNLKMSQRGKPGYNIGVYSSSLSEKQQKLIEWEIMGNYSYVRNRK